MAHRASIAPWLSPVFKYAAASAPSEGVSNEPFSIFAVLVALSALCAALAPHALAYDGIAKKEVFTLPSYTTVNGKTIKNVRVGYESYGKLNAAKDNVVLICHFFTGTSHAAGKYKPEDAAPGTGTPSSARAKRSTPTSIS